MVVAATCLGHMCVVEIEMADADAQDRGSNDEQRCLEEARTWGCRYRSLLAEEKEKETVTHNFPHKLI